MPQLASFRGCGAGPVRATGHGVSFGLYLFGIVLVIGALIYGAAIMNVPTHWIVVIALLMLGAGIIAAVKSTRQRDPAK